MAKKYGEAGTGAKQMANKRRLAILGLAGIALLFALVFAMGVGPGAKIGLPVIVVLLVAFKVFERYADKKANELSKRSKDADRGAEAEERVASVLSNLPEGFEVFNDVQFDGFNIDHVVASSAGVFLIETKSHGGKVSAEGDSLLLNGKAPEKDFLNQTWSQTYRLREYLKERMGIEIKIQPVLCFSSAFVEVRKPVKGITVLNIKYLKDYLSKQKDSISPQMLSRVRVALKRKI